MAKKYKTKIEITSQADNKDEAMEIVGDYLSGNITSGIDMRCTTKPVHFYDNTGTKVAAIALLIPVLCLFSYKTTYKSQSQIGACQIAAVQAPLKTSSAINKSNEFKKEWEEKQTREALNLIKK